MRTERQPSKTVQCVQCTDVYMVTGETAIRLAQPRPVTIVLGFPLQGTCPKHRQRGI